MPSLPTGTVTFLFTDIEGSTRLIEDLGDTVSTRILADHRQLLAEAVETAGGTVYQDHGEGFVFVFPRAKDAIRAAVAAQRALTACSWANGRQVRVRMGLHTGEPVGEAGEYVGLDVHRAARICGAGHGGQILLSQTTHDLAMDDFPDGVRVRDLGQHHLKDIARPLHLYQIVTADLPTHFPPLKSLDGLANNLPVQLTSFIGREREIAEVKRLLSTLRLLTLTSTGGAGKTRLALRVAADLLDQYPDGVWLAELAALNDPTLVSQTVAAALSVREHPGRLILTTLTDFLRDKHLLLILDNCEHLLVACAELLDRLLRACQHLQVLATSREALGLAGEFIFRVPSLSVPDLHAIHAPERMMEYEAVRLFVERATFALPRFALTSVNAGSVARICARLDGIPLAIELAAARVVVLSPEQIEARLVDRFRLLTGGGRTTLPRQQTLRAAMDWSYDLLSEPERVLLRRVSVFPSSFTLEAADTICRDGFGPDDLLDLLARLVQRSLVIAEEQGRAFRYEMLETVRQYAREKLVNFGEEGATHRRHCTWYLTLIERAEPELRGSEQVAWLSRLEMEHDNVRAALKWSLDTGDSETALRLVSGVWRFWDVRGYYSEGRGWLEAVLKNDVDAPPALRAKALGGAGYLATRQGDFAAARSLLEESLAIQQSLGDPRGMANALNWLGNVAWRQGDLDRAQALYQEALALFQVFDATESIGVVLNNLGILRSIREDYVAARALFEESMAIWQRSGHPLGIAHGSGNLAVVALRQGDVGAARTLIEESLRIDRELSDRRGMASDLEVLGLLAAALGRADCAARALGAAEAARDAIGAHLAPFERRFYDYERYMGEIRGALEEPAFHRAWAEGRAMTLDEGIEHALSGTS